ncbi:MAG: bifunctional DNA-formamidopyrimidine glycosylase/DNA-(apurinic or apyrimidinic site) lyase [Burkholderiaceae bacterium]
MPELPEVEVVGRGVRAAALGHRVRDVIVRERRLRWPVAADLRERVAGQGLSAVTRRGKYLLLDFGNGSLIVHLGMSGNFRFLADPPPAGAHDHVDLVFDHGLLRFNDPRRFGAIIWHEGGGVLAHPLLRGLGIEPFDAGFDGGHLFAATRGRRLAIKQLLLAGHAVVGVGNIYASESLHRAGIRPSTAAGRLARARCDRLAGAIRETLADAILQGGSTLRDFDGADGAGGYFQLSCRVYGREGLGCPTCGEPVRRSVQQARATYWCRRCQR